MSTIRLNDGRVVSKKDYIEAKTKDLIEFGYTTLTEDDVKVEVEKILTNVPDRELSVIGMFCKGDFDLS